MTTEDPNLYPQALAVMLAVWRRTQKELEAAADLPEQSVSNYLHGRVRLEREDLEQLAGHMGFFPAFVDRTLDYLRSAPADAASEARGSFAAMRERVAARFGQALEGLVRDCFDELLRETEAWNERRRGAELWDRLGGYPHAGRLALVEEDGDFRGWALCERLCDESERAAPRSAQEARELAELTLAVAEREPGPPDRRARLEARAGAYLGNALRVSGDLSAADEAFARAARRRLDAGEMLFVEAPGAPPLDLSRELDLEASLRRDQRRFKEALELLDEAAELAPDDEARARIELKRAKTLEEDDRHAEAADLLRRSWALVEGTRDDRLRWALRVNLLENLSQAGRPEEAAELLPQARWMAADLGKFDLLRLRWVEGRLLALQGSREEAIAVLDEVRRAFAEEGIAFDAALATLELAVEMLALGRTAEVKRLAREMAPIFRAQGVDRERFGAWLLFEEAAEREALTEAAARRLLTELRAARPRRNGVERS